MKVQEAIKLSDSTQMFGIFGYASLLLFKDEGFKSQLGLVAEHGDFEQEILTQSIGAQAHPELGVPTLHRGESVYAAVLLSVPAESDRDLGNLKMNFVITTKNEEVSQFGEEIAYRSGLFPKGNSGLIPFYIRWEVDDSIKESGTYIITAKIQEDGGPLKLELSEKVQVSLK
ncbi:MAG: hypothetical protein KDD60_03565 [Bdellovibrionales bacterium]|nr:hypothetical protein [Bdellovibrionales bacterium]